MSYKFDKNKKISKKSQYTEVFANKQSLHSRYFQIIYKKTNKISRLGLAISKKNHKLSTQRNRLKRIIREVFRHNLNHNFDIIILNKKFININNSALFIDLNQLITKLK